MSFSRQGPARIWGRPIPSSEVLFLCFLYRRGRCCVGGSLFGVVSENAALFFEKEGVFSLWGWRVGFVFFQAVM